MDPLKGITKEQYQMLVQLAAKNETWAAYFLLINICYQITQNIPEKLKTCTSDDAERLLIQGLEKVGKALSDILPGGIDEFAEYMPS